MGVTYRITVAALLLLPPVTFFILAVALVDIHPSFSRLCNGARLFCERTYTVEESVLCQKANGLSSFFYMFLPIAVVWSWDRDAAHTPRAHVFGRASPESALLVCIGVYMTIGNLGMHCFCIPRGALMDVTSMNLMMGVFVAQAVSRLCGRRAIFWVVMLLHLGVQYIGTFYWGQFWNLEVGVNIAILLVLYIKFIFCSGRKPCRPLTYWSILTNAIFYVCFAFWLNGLNDSKGCHPRSLFQPHAVWHLNAVALWTTWRAAMADTDAPTQLAPPVLRQHGVEMEG